MTRTLVIMPIQVDVVDGKVVGLHVPRTLPGLMVLRDSAQRSLDLGLTADTLAIAESYLADIAPKGEAS